MNGEYSDIREQINDLNEQITKLEKKDQVDEDRLEKLRGEHNLLRQKLRRGFAEKPNYDLDDLEDGLRDTLENSVDISDTDVENRDVYAEIVSIRFYRRQIADKDLNSDSINELVEKSKRVEEELWDIFYRLL